jgi:hypothetical protein
MEKASALPSKVPSKVGGPNPSNKIKHVRYIELIGPRIIKFQTFMTFSNKYNLDSGLSHLFTGF